jgi:hypothetical protein
MWNDPIPSFCVACGFPTDDVGNGGERKPCQKCGEIGRKADIIGNLSIGMSVRVSKIKGVSKIRRIQKKNKVFWDEKHVEEIYRDTGEIHIVFRLIDRIRNIYRERITDKISGDIKREITEPLSEHKERGSAKNRK